MRYYRGAFGGSISMEHMKKYSPVTLVLIGINVVIFIISMILGIHRDSILFGGMAPINYIVNTNEYWRFLTSMFIHSNIMHIAFNMVILMHAGAYYEQKNGSKSFLKFYIMTGLFVSLSSGLFVSGLSVGASGAIFALLGYILYYDLEARKRGIINQSMILPLVILNIIITVLVPQISTVGHLSGLLIGYLIPMFINNKTRGISH
ncbi:rhomboid family intramembrane serine protease [Desulfuribacillus alkaliarsenatis]|uniref:Peptidase S54 rhomboid domain-containing protein n=1 Tax=Desulfuribacillus alkaliarsenatis TaxID=766136 RepID=A0A1E5G0X4_9FIRM|nr:rhomboid family intramembrane serine protease [Desulfuribacillus alkaliarsenatis]OEF96098.1 hypothetical protein BHF68_10210 [Desulfuribacillus alkaliarsenatis]